MKSKYEGTVKGGDIFGKWKVIDCNIVKLRGNACVKVKCECGFEGIRSIGDLVKKNSTCCDKCGHSKKGDQNKTFKGYKLVPGSFVQRYRRSAKNKGFQYKISAEIIYNKWIQQKCKCALSGVDISFENEVPDPTRYQCTASIDRIDSKVGYIPTNIQIVHKFVNIMKNYFDENEFIKMCENIVSHRKESCKIE